MLVGYVVSAFVGVGTSGAVIFSHDHSGTHAPWLVLLPLGRAWGGGYKKRL